MAEMLIQGLREQPGRYLLPAEPTTHSMWDPDLRVVLVAHQHHPEKMAADLLAEVAARTGCSLTVEPLSVARFFPAGFDGIAQRHPVMGEDTANALDADTSRLVAATLALAGVS
ncbi:hypothetical protein [Streptomyces sp. SID3343]|uniref:hypothetical protein n=1 Tax=Streptomyces sp. SID3343 TaxID=2690260 RepID=UPI001F4606EE|nr:hypothetical protein [Streptomyces sp. SID3343]